MSVKVSVIIACHNDGAYLQTTLLSVLSQNFQEFEIILVDDGSTDNTSRLLKQAADSDERIRCVICPDNVGPLQARIIGLNLAAGEYICFYDCGDRVEQDVLSDFYAAAKEENADIIIGGYTMDVRFPAWQRAVQDHIEGHTTVLHALLANKGISAMLFNKMYRRSVLTCWADIRETGRLGEDLYLNLLAFNTAKKFAVVKNTGYHWRYSGLGKKYYLEKWGQYEEMMTKVLNLIGKLSVNSADREILTESLKERVYSACLERLCWSRMYSVKRKTSGKILEECVRLLQSLGCDTTNASLKEDSKKHLRAHWKYFLFFYIVNLFNRIG